MTFNPKVSIIIPVYNGSNYLREAIDSALAQTYKNIEIIVVNDGSNDGGKTEEIAKSYGDKIRYFYKENGGVATALNLGIRKAEGKYISWLSHDDLYLLNKVERQIHYLSKSRNRNLILYSDFEALDLRNNSTHICRIEHVEPDNYLYDILLLLFRSVIHGCTTLIPMSCFDEVGVFNEKLGTTQDYELWFKMVKKGYEFRHMPEVLIKTRWHNEQGTVSLSDIHYKEVEDLCVWAVELFSNEIKTFSRGQIEKIFAALKNKSLKRSQYSVLKCWRGDNPSRLVYQIIIESKQWCYDLANSIINSFIQKKFYTR